MEATNLALVVNEPENAHFVGIDASGGILVKEAENNLVLSTPFLPTTVTMVKSSASPS